MTVILLEYADANFPVGTKMCFLQPEPPKGWRVLSRKGPNILPPGQKDRVCITCEKE